MFLKWLNKAEESIISLLLVGMTLLVFVEVVLRFGFNTGFTWSQELTLHLSAWFVLFGASYGLKVHAHIGVDAFVKLFPVTGQRVLTAIAIVLALAYCALFLYGSWIYLDKMYLIGIDLEDLPVPTWLAHGMLLVGFTFFSIRLLEMLWGVATGRVNSFGQADEAKESMHLAEELKAGEGKS